MLKLLVNGENYEIEVDSDTPLLWVLRDLLGLTGTRYSCGIGQCGACTVHVAEQPVRSCSYPVSAAVGLSIVTIEGLSGPLQEAWVAEQVPQCGYCQSGQIMAAAALLQRQPQPSDAEIDAAMTNLCRCGSYPRIRRAIHRAATAAGP